MRDNVVSGLTQRDEEVELARRTAIEPAPGGWSPPGLVPGPPAQVYTGPAVVRSMTLCRGKKLVALVAVHVESVSDFKP